MLSTIYPEKAHVDDLISWVEPKNVSYYRNNVIRPLHKERLIELDKNWDCLILPPGLNYIEKSYPAWMANLNKER